MLHKNDVDIVYCIVIDVYVVTVLFVVEGLVVVSGVIFVVI